MTRTLVVAPQWIGDAVMCEPLLALLAARGEQLTVAALPWVAPVFRAMPQVGAVVETAFRRGRLDWAGRRRIARAWRGRFDAAYVLPNTLKSALLPWLARIPLRIGYHGEGRYLLLNRRLANPPGRPPMVGFYAALAGSSGASFERPRLHVDDARRVEATTRHGLRDGAFFAFAPGAEFGPAKRWPAEQYAALARALHAAHGLPIALLGAPGEAALCEQISGAAPGACRVLAGPASLDDAIALIGAARGIVSNDSGLMHVAAALGVPQVAVFGSTSPAHTPPLNARAEVLWLKDELQLDCMPCFDRSCRYGDTRCLTGVSAERVGSALMQVLEQAGASQGGVPTCSRPPRPW